MGDKAPMPEAWMQPAIESVPSPEDVAEFDKMVKMLMVQEALHKARQANEIGENKKIEWDGKSILPPHKGKKESLYEKFFSPEL